MAIGTTAALIAGGAAVAGGVAGALGGGQTTTSSVNAGQATQLENMGLAEQRRRFGELGNLVNLGPGASDITAGTSAARSFAQMLQGAISTSGLPTQQDISASQGIVGQLFQPQQVAMQQAFEDQGIQAQRQAALLGRSGDDPILRARLAQEQTRQQAMLGAQQGAASQQLAMQLPGQRLSFAGQRAQVLGGLATQALQNRQALTSLGGQLVGQERNMRLATATRTTQTEPDLGSRIAGGLTGAVGGLSAGLGIGGQMGLPGIQAPSMQRQAAPQQMRAPAMQQQQFFDTGFRPTPTGMDMGSVSSIPLGVRAAGYSPGWYGG